jgi:hypothetical protein
VNEDCEDGLRVLILMVPWIRNVSAPVPDCATLSLHEFSCLYLFFFFFFFVLPGSWCGINIYNVLGLAQTVEKSIFCINTWEMFWAWPKPSRNPFFVLTLGITTQNGKYYLKLKTSIFYD